MLIYSIFNNIRYDGYHLVKSCIDNLVYDLMQALKAQKNTTETDENSVYEWCRP